MTPTEPNNTVPTESAHVAPQPGAPVVEAPTRPVSFSYDLERQLRPYQRWLVVMVVATLGATCLLVSAGHGAKDGTLPWSPNSVLRLAVEMLNFNYAFPTPRGNDVKWLAQGLGAAAALMTAGIVWYVRTGRRKGDEDLVGELESQAAASERKPLLEHLSLVRAAQIAMVAFGLWAVLSTRWAHWPDVAMGEGLRNLFVIVWAVALAVTMNRWSALRAGVGMGVILAIVAIVGIWYHFERNPVLRLEFPIGNPIFFAACMLPALMLAVAGIAGAIEQLVRGGEPTLPPPSGASARRVQPTQGASGRMRTILILVGSILVLIVVGWAFWLTHSRAPAVALLIGLAAGAGAMILRWVPRRRRRLAVLGMVVIALGAVVLVGRPWLRSQESIAAGGRGASLRMRFYAWQYAKDLFLGYPLELPTGQRVTSPLTGQGQGSYVALSQWLAMSPRDAWGRSDIERDPAAFVGGLVGHAHNEWLEILAELGAIGFALMATALALTFWAGWRAFMRAEKPAEKWFLLALMASLLAIIVEECADVALRMPVLPLIFYTVIGLLWAFSRERAREAPSSRAWCAGWLGPVGLIAAVLGAIFISSAVRRDWRGALADGRVAELLEKQQWDAAMGHALVAREGRLAIENQVSASVQVTRVAHAAAAQRYDQFRTMLARQSAPSNRTRIRSIAQEDIAEFDRHFQNCLTSGMQLWAAVPGIHSVTDWMADVLLMKHELESLKPSLGLEPEDAPFLPTARHWILMEYQRDRFNAATGLRLFGISSDQPMDFRIELLRIPLRMGPQPAGSIAGIEDAVRQILAREPNSFNHYLEALLRHAEQAASQPDPDLWPDPYAPETLRLKAIVEQLSGRYEQAAEYGAQAVKLYESPRLRFYYPTALAHGLGNLARWQFLAEPDQPRKAAELGRRALESWPAGTQVDEHWQLLRRDYSLYLLAAGEHAAASDVIRDQVGALSEDRLNRNLGYGLAEICGMFADRAPTARPAAFHEWLQRSVELAPGNPRARWLAARVAFEEDKSDEAIEHLKAVQANLDDSQQMDALLQSLAAGYPDNPQLKAFIEARSPESQPGPNPSSMPSDDGFDPGNPENGQE